MSTVETIQVHAIDKQRLRVSWSALIGNKAHEYWVKARGQRIKGQGMIAADTNLVRAGFTQLQGRDFADYNLPQAWVESRQIPQVLHGRAPREGTRILDLGCGPGTSTTIISHFANPCWTIIGYDFVREYIEQAKKLVYNDGYLSRMGNVIRPRFECQSIADPLLLDNEPLPAASFHMAVSGGVVGLYLRHEQCQKLIKELYRVIIPGGWIALDAGPSIPPAKLHQICAQAGFQFVTRAKSFIIEPRPKLIFQKVKRECK